MDNKELMSILFKASKDEKIKGGDLTCGAALSSGKTELIIVAKDAKNGIKTKFGQLGFKYDVEIVIHGLSTEFSWITNKKGVEVIAIIDKEVADEVKRVING